jgi:hypothetical protein
MTVITVDVEVNLSDFCTEDLIEELECRGQEQQILSCFDLIRIEHLVTCGMLDQAKIEAWQMIEKALESRT